MVIIILLLTKATHSEKHASSMPPTNGGHEKHKATAPNNMDMFTLVQLSIALLGDICAGCTNLFF